MKLKVLFLFVYFSLAVSCLAANDDSKWRIGVWTFDKEAVTQGWTFSDSGSGQFTKDGCKIKVLPQTQLRMISPRHTVTPFVTDYICARVKSDKPLTLRLAFRTEKLYKWSDDKVAAPINLAGDSKFHDIEFNLKHHPLWDPQNGWALQVAFVFETQSKDSAQVAVNWIRTQECPLADWTGQLWAQSVSDEKVELDPLPVTNKFRQYTDDETRNVVQVLTALPGKSVMFYHYYNPFNRDSKWMAFRFVGDGEYYKYSGFYNINLANGKLDRLTGPDAGIGIIQADGNHLIYLGPRNSFGSASVLSLWQLNLQTKLLRRIFDFPPDTGLNDYTMSCDNKSVILQTYFRYVPTADETAAMQKMVPRDAAMASVALQTKHKPRFWNISIDLETRQMSQICIIDHATMHNQCSPTDANLMLVQWQSWLAMPFWFTNIRTGSYRPVFDYDQWDKNYREFVFGHPSWAADGKTIWCEARQWLESWSPEEEAVFRDPELMFTAEKKWQVCKIDVATGKVKLWPVDFDGWTPHYTATPWDNIILCDGSYIRNYISLIKLDSNEAQVNRLCKVPHKYQFFEPMCYLSPDRKSVLFQTMYQNQQVIWRSNNPAASLAIGSIEMMNSKQRTRLVFEGKMPDRPPLGFFAIDSDTAAKVLGRPTYWRAKAKCQIALWQGRRDEVVQSWIADAIELHKKLDIVDIVPVCTHMAGICPPRGYIPDPPRQIDESTWEDRHGCIYKYSQVTDDITIIYDPTVWKADLLAALNQPFEAIPDQSIFEAVDAMIDAFREERFILGPCGPVEAWLLFGSLERGFMEIASNPQVIKRLYQKKVNSAKTLDTYYIRPGQDGVMCGTDMASTIGPMINPAIYRELFLSDFTSRIKAVKDRGQFFIKHACGNNWPLLDIFVEMGIDCYQSIQPTAGMDIVEVHKKYADKFVVWGGLSVESLVSGTMQDVRREVRNVMENLSDKGRFIFGTSHSVAVGTIYDNFMAMLDEYNKCLS